MMKLNMDKLTELVDSQEKDTFYYKDFDHPEGGDRYRIFNYRLASFNDFQQNPMLLWCRGTMFNLKTGKVVSRPMSKFFNYHEWKNNSTDLPDSTYWRAAVKHDGSLVSSYLHSDGQVYMKSKFSLESSQAVNATRLWQAECEETDLDNKIIANLHIQETYNREYCAPDNLIVVPYAKEEMFALNVINNETGEYIADVESSMVHSAILDEWINEVYEDSETLHEGYVMVSEDLQERFKVKTNRYLAAHRAKDDINSTKKLVNIIYSGDIDDLLRCRDLGADEAFHKLLLDKSEFIKDRMNKITSECEAFYNENSSLDRKSYAIKAQTVDIPLGCVMNLYLSKEPDYLSYFMKNLDMFERDLSEGT